MEYVMVHAVPPSLFVCKLSVCVAEGNLVIWSRGALRAPGQERLTDRWGKPLIRKLKRYEWIEGALLDDRTAHIVCQDVQSVADDELIDLFDRLMPNRELAIGLVRHGDVFPGHYRWRHLPAPEGPRIPQR